MTGDQYWSEIADSGDDHIAYPLWRDYCDTLHARLLRSWLHGAKFPTALKTDLFDEACGNGMASELERIAGRIIGLDISQSIAKRAARRHPVMNVAVEDVRKISLGDGSVDFVFSNSTLDHFAEPSYLEKSLREIVRILAPGRYFASMFQRFSRKRRIQSGNVNPVRKAGWRSANALLKRLFHSSLMSQRG